MIGRVVSAKMKNTVTVLVERTAMHPLYKKTFIRTKKYLVMAQAGVKEGDVVEIVKVKPISKNKHWQVAKVVGKDLEALTADVLKAEAEKLVAEVLPEEKEEVSGQNKELSEEAKGTIEKVEKVKRAKKEDKDKNA